MSLALQLVTPHSFFLFTPPSRSGTQVDPFVKSKGVRNQEITLQAQGLRNQALSKLWLWGVNCIQLVEVEDNHDFVIPHREWRTCRAPYARGCSPPASVV
jgi:hypothetical protein